MLPQQLDLDRLTVVVTDLTKLPLSSQPETLRQSVRVILPPGASSSDIWRIYCQLLADHEMTVVMASDQTMYRVLALKDAARFARLMTIQELEGLTYPPGFVQVSVPVKFLGVEGAIAVLSPLVGTQSGSVRSLGAGQATIVIAGVRHQVVAALQALAKIDQPSSKPTIKQYLPKNTTAARLQTTLTTSWASIGKQGGALGPADILVSADSSSILIVGAEAATTQILALVDTLDATEPVSTATYRPSRYPLAEVANLLEQVMGAEEGRPMKVIRDQLTGSLIITASQGQHDRIKALIKNLDEAPAGSERQLACLPVKHRQVAELLTVVQELLAARGENLSAGNSTGSKGTAPASSSVATPPGGEAANPPLVAHDKIDPAKASMPAPSLARSGDLHLSADERTNSILVLGTPSQIHGVRRLLEQIDQAAPQVLMEVVLVSLSESEGQQFGLDLAALRDHAAISLNAGTLTGLFTKSNNAPSPTNIPGAVLGAGDYAVVVKALETITKSRGIVRSKMVAENGAKTALNSVLQQPIATINTSNQTTSSTTFGGTSDAGTQVLVTPMITAADQVNVTFSISQSSFQAAPSSSGLPPPKQNTSLSSVVSLPDGHVIALGGITSTNEGQSQSHVPWLGRIPLIGWMFGEHGSNSSNTRFLIFVKVDVLREKDYADLSRFSLPLAADVGIDAKGEPVGKPRFLE